MAELSDYEIGLARQKAIETWPLACDVQQEFVSIVEPAIENENDLHLMRDFTTWHWSPDPQWKLSKVVDVEVLDGADVGRLEKLIQQFETAWRVDLEIEHLTWFAAEETAEPGGWLWRTLAHAYRPKSPRAYVVSGILPLPSLSIFYGSPGDLKTMLCQDMALCVAAGKSWLEGLPGQDPVKAFGCQRAAVLWVDVDCGADRLERRWAALGKAHNIPENAPLQYISFPTDPPFVASDPKAIGQVVNAAVAMGAKLIVVDNLGTVSGGVDENSSQMVSVMSGLRWLAETTGAAVITIHHRTKADKSRAGNQLRGHSSIEGSLDLALFVEREEGTDIVRVRSTKSRDIPFESFEVLWTYESEGNDLQTGRFFGLGAAEPKADDRKNKAREAILQILEERPGLSQRSLVKAVKEVAEVGKGLTVFVLRQLVKEGKVNQNPGEQYGAYSYLVSQCPSVPLGDRDTNG